MKKKHIIGTIASSAALMVGWIFVTNNIVKQTNYNLFFKNIPESFDGFKIAHISDFHNSEMVDKTENIIKANKPDIIVITGDLIEKYEMDNAIKLIRNISSTAPIYFVPGNHEGASPIYKDLYEEMLYEGVEILNNENHEIWRDDEKINILGIQDPLFLKRIYTSSTNEILTSIEIEKHISDGFTILLDHRPELFNTYINGGIDLVFSGHAHGGQFRLPLIGGLYAPGQGVFPKYDNGIFEKDGTRMVVSRGIGESSFPFRLNNTPEVVITTLYKK